MSETGLANEKETDESELEGLQGIGHLEGLVGGEWLLVMLAIVCLILTFPVSLWLCLQVVNEYEEPVLLRLGHIRRIVSKGPGVYFILPCTDQLIRVDMRIKTYEMPFQEVFTKDPLLIDVGGIIYYRIHDAILAVTKVSSPESAIQLLTQAVIKNTLGAKTLFQIITEQEHIAKDVQAQLGNVTTDWGVTVERVEIKNVKTKVNVGSARRLTSPSKIVKGASIIIQEHPLSLQFSCLEIENTSSGQPNSTIIFAFP